MSQVTRRRLMDRKIVEMLREDAGIKLIARNLHVSKKRVKQLRRVRIDNVKLAHLKVGQWRNLTEAELKGLLPGRTQW